MKKYLYTSSKLFFTAIMISDYIMQTKDTSPRKGGIILKFCIFLQASFGYYDKEIV